MLKDLKLLGKETLVYGLSTVAGRLLNFLLLPLYTHFLAPGDFGIIATIYAYLAFLNVIYQYGMDQAYLRYATSLEVGDAAENFSTPVWSVALSSAILSGILCAAAGPLARVIGLPASLSGIVACCAGILALDALAVVPFAELRRAHRAWAYVGAKTANIILNVALNVFFLWRLRLGAQGVVLASLVSSAATLLLLSPVLASLLRPRFHRGLFEAMLRFGAPYIPAGLASMAVQVIDRPILKALTDDATVGIYQANYRLGIFMMMAVNMFDAAWRPFFLERASKPGAQAVFGRVLTYFLAAACFIVLALSLFIGDLVRVPILGRPIIHPNYWGGLGVVPVVLLGYLFNGVYLNFMAQVTIPKRTDLLIYATGAGAAVNIGANLALIPFFGMMGAAWATLLAYAAMAACLYRLGQPLYPIPYEKNRLIQVVSAFTASAALASASRWAEAGPAAWLGARLAALAGFPMLLYASGFFNEGELAAARRLFGRFRGRV